MRELLVTENVPDGLLSALSGREATLWLHRLPSGLEIADLVQLIGLPWRSVVLGESTSKLLDALSADADPTLIQRRGYIQIVQTDPSLISLPPRSLPVYDLGAQDGSESSFDATLRRMAMLGALRRSGVRQLVVVSDDDGVIPADLVGIVDSAFQPFLTFVSGSDVGRQVAADWATKESGGPPAQLVALSPTFFAKGLIERYGVIYPADANVVRFRSADGSYRLVDITLADDVERPILTSYDLIQERDLAIVAPQDLKEDEFLAFFEGKQDSWRPYSAGVPWIKDDEASRRLRRLLRKSDDVGPLENKIAFIAAQPGAGGTTLSRALAYEAAREGYPALVAKPIPFSPDALPVVSFLTKAHQAFLEKEKADDATEQDARRLYETPWVLVFDRAHFEHRESELRHFLNELTKSGRPAILLVVTSPINPLEYYPETVAQEISAPTHFLEAREVEALGRHLNAYLRVYQKARSAEAWSAFHREHSVDRMNSVAAFWIALSFWLRTSKDITGSIQEWVYEAFVERATSKALRLALIEIAALSSERLPLSEGLLPKSDNEWPLSARLEDERQNLSALGLMRVKTEDGFFWGLAHDILGRLLINALFYDFTTRSELGFSDARDPEHLRFLALKNVATKGVMAEVRHRAFAEQFATTIFKVDPDHGASAFSTIWREVLVALDEMPRLLRDTSRVFRHHTAISRRRIAAFDNPLYGVSTEDRTALLERAIEDIGYALTSIDRRPGDEPDLNLYNSLANAYLNLADVLALSNGDPAKVGDLRRLANEATRRAYDENPTNPWVIETHIRNLIGIARSAPERSIEASLEALLAVYDALRATDANLRTDKLGHLGEEALAILLSNAPDTMATSELRNPIDVLIAAWRLLWSAGATGIDDSLINVPAKTADEVLAVLSHTAGQGDVQVIRFQYGVLSAAYPFQFARRLALVENLHSSRTQLSPQLQLEYALLLYQVGRAPEGDRKFRSLRSLWRDAEFFVNVPDALGWLRDGETDSLRTVQAHAGSEQGFRPMARVSDFGNLLAPFRPEEFAVRNLRPGTPFRAHVSFGHNGPFLRPTSAGPRRGG